MFNRLVPFLEILFLKCIPRKQGLHYSHMSSIFVDVSLRFKKRVIIVGPPIKESFLLVFLLSFIKKVITATKVFLFESVKSDVCWHMCAQWNHHSQTVTYPLPSKISHLFVISASHFALPSVPRQPLSCLSLWISLCFLVLKENHSLFSPSPHISQERAEHCHHWITEEYSFWSQGTRALVLSRQ